MTSELRYVQESVERMRQAFDSAVVDGWPPDTLGEVVSHLAGSVKEIEIYLTKQEKLTATRSESITDG